MTINGLIAAKRYPNPKVFPVETAAELQFLRRPPGGAQSVVQSVSNEVGGEDSDAPVVQPPLPPVVLGVGRGDAGDAVAGDEAQVAGLLSRERVGRRDDQLTARCAHRRSSAWRGIKYSFNK